MKSWIGDAATIRASYVRKQKTDRRDAAHILQAADRRPLSASCGDRARTERDLRQLLIHRHKLVGDPGAGEERFAAPDAEPGRATEAKLWNEAGQKALQRIAAGRLGGTTREGSAAACSRNLDPQIRRTRSSGRASCEAEPASTVADDAARSRADHGAGVRGDAGGCHVASSVASRWPATWG